MSVFEMSFAEKLQLVEDLWDDLVADPSQVPVHDWQREELDRRRVRLENSPDGGLSWEEVKARVLAGPHPQGHLTGSD